MFSKVHIISKILLHSDIIAQNRRRGRFISESLSNDLNTLTRDVFKKRVLFLQNVEIAE